MCRDKRNVLVQQELASYIKRKSQLAGLDKDQILASRKLLRAAFVVCCIDEVLASMDEQSREYIRRRYLVDESDKAFSIAMDLNMSRRTSNRRHKWFVDRVARLLDIE